MFPVPVDHRWAHGEDPGGSTCLQRFGQAARNSYLHRQLLEHLSLLTPTSAAARQSTRVGDAVMKALGSTGGH